MSLPVLGRARWSPFAVRPQASSLHPPSLSLACSQFCFHASLAVTVTKYRSVSFGRCAVRLRNDLYCVGWGVKLYSLTHAARCATSSLASTFIVTTATRARNVNRRRTMLIETSEFAPLKYTARFAVCNYTYVGVGSVE